MRIEEKEVRNCEVEQVPPTAKTKKAIKQSFKL